MEKLIILGGNGFIGTNLAAHFLNKGIEVYSFDIVKPEKIIDGVTYIEGDFFDDQNLFDALANKDMIIHAISTVNPGNSNEKYMQGYSRDFVQSIKVFEYAIQNKQQLIFLSSGGTVYGEQVEQPISEDANPRPINHYGNIKLCIENTIRTFNRQQNSNLKIVRMSNPYGPGQDSNKGVGFIDAAVKCALNGEVLKIWGDGEIIRDYIYIDDVCNLIFSIFNYDGEFDTFNISSGIGTSQNDIIKLIRRLGFTLNVDNTEARNVDLKMNILNNERILSINKINILDIKTGILKYINYLQSTF